MNDDDIKAIFGEDVQIIRIDPGKVVLCDLCNDDFTNSEEKGGILFQSKAVCPHCNPSFSKLIKKHNEERFIRAVALEGESFRDFVYRIRKFEEEGDERLK